MVSLRIGCDRSSPGCGAASTLAGDEFAQALVVLAAGRAAGEVGAHPGHLALGLAAGELGLDVLVEAVEAVLAAELGPLGAEHPVDQRSVHGAAPRSWSASAARSRRRASWRVL